MPGSRRRRSARTAALVLGGALTLTACGGSDGDGSGGSSATAAIVDGEEITVGEVQRSSRELGEVIAAQAEGRGEEPQELGPDSLISSLVQVPAILAYARDEGLSVPSEAAIERQLEEVVPAPSPATVDFFRASAVHSQLDQQQQQAVGEQVREQEVTLSPRYRQDGDGPNWLEQTENEQPLEMP